MFKEIKKYFKELFGPAKPNHTKEELQEITTTIVRTWPADTAFKVENPDPDTVRIVETATGRVLQEYTIETFYGIEEEQ